MARSSSSLFSRCNEQVNPRPLAGVGLECCQDSPAGQVDQPLVPGGVKLGGDQFDHRTELAELGVFEQLLIGRQQLEIVLKPRVAQAVDQPVRVLNLDANDRVGRDHLGGIGRAWFDPGRRRWGCEAQPVRSQGTRLQSRNTSTGRSTRSPSLESRRSIPCSISLVIAELPGVVTPRWLFMVVPCPSLVFECGDRESWSTNHCPFALDRPFIPTRTNILKFRKTANPSTNPEKRSSNLRAHAWRVVMSQVFRPWPRASWLAGSTRRRQVCLFRRFS